MSFKILFIALFMLAAGRANSAEFRAMDLSDGRARWVLVQFESSPAESPGRLDSEYSPRLPAWFEPGPEGQRATVTIGRDVVEEYLFRDESPVARSFSDFIWDFDVETGHVASARLSGVVSRNVKLGFVRASTRVEIRVDMSTVRAVGYRARSRLFGNPLYRLCHVSGRNCTIVDPREFDRGTGYANAVGGLEANTVGSRVRTFSPLGEAVFTELPTSLLRSPGSGPGLALGLAGSPATALAPVASAGPSY